MKIDEHNSLFDQDEQCDNCTHWKMIFIGDDFNIGVCTRFPPKFNPSDMEYEYPVMHRNLGCGEHKVRGL